MDEDVAKISKLVEKRTFNLLNPNGKFTYQIDVNTDKPIKGEYNLLRHFGTLWYLGGLTDPVKRAYAIKGLKWADEKYLIHVPEYSGTAYMYKDTIKTGGLALAILAKISLNSLDGIEKLGSFLLSCQKDNGDFVHKFDAKLKDTGFVSEYYTGEILFALASLQKIMPDKKRIRAICKAIDYLISIGYGIKEQSHWMMYALEAIYKVNCNPAYPAHAYAISQNIIKNTEFQKRGANPIACRVEGMLAYARLRKLEQPGGNDYLTWASFIESNIKLMLNPSCYKNGYFHTNYVSQIDNQQHCGSAIREYINLMRKA